MQQQKQEQSLGELFTNLASQTSTLVRQEVQLAKTEMTQKATSAGKDIAFLGVGGAVAYAGFLAIIAAIIILLGLVIPLWASALLIGLIVAAVGYFLVDKGLSQLKKIDPAPRQTIASLQEDKEWAKEQTK